MLSTCTTQLLAISLLTAAISAENWTASALMHVRKAHLDTTAWSLDGCYVSKGCTIFAVGGDNNTDQTATVQMYNDKRWTAGPSLIQARSDLGVASLGSEIIAAGGWSSAEQKALATVELLDAATLSTRSRWVAAPTMLQGRNGLKIAALDSKLYAVGGANTTGDNLCTMEVLEFEGASYLPWKAAPSMKVCREGHGVAVLGGKLYAVGGLSDDAAPMTSMEVYDPRTKSWIKGPDMNTGRFQFALAVHDEKLYAVGGADSIGNPIQTSEIFDPVKNSWSVGPPLPSGRRSSGAASMGGSIYVVGGIGESGDALKTVEEFK